jgi:hypothetical protein
MLMRFRGPSQADWGRLRILVSAVRFRHPADVGVGTRWERIVSPRGLLCPLVSPRNLPLCRAFLMGTGLRGR